MCITGPCKDDPRKRNTCATLRKRRLCDRFPNEKRRFCPRSCGVCKGLYSVVYFIRRNHPFKYIQQCRKYSSARQMQVKILMDELKNSAISPTGDL